MNVSPAAVADEWRRVRRIRLADAPAGSADWFAAIAGEDGVEDIAVRDGVCEVRYDLLRVDLNRILELLADAGLTPRDDPWQRLQLGVWRLTEAIKCDNRDADFSFEAVIREVYISRYRHRRHGRRDDRPQHWRQYRSKSPPG